MADKKTIPEATADFNRKSGLFHNAIRSCELLNGLTYNSHRAGVNEWNDRYWTAVFDKKTPDFNLSKDSMLTYGSAPGYSVVFVYDTVLDKYLTLTAGPELTDGYNSACYFARMYEKQASIVLWFVQRLVVHKLDLETFQVTQTIDSNHLPNKEHLAHCFKESSPNSGKFTDDGNYFAYSPGENGHTSVIVQLNWEKNEMNAGPLLGKRIWHVRALFVLKTETTTVAAIPMTATNGSEPDGGCSIYLPYGDSQNGLHHYQTFIGGSPTRIEFSEVDPDGYVTLKMFNYIDSLKMSAHIPANMKTLKDEPGSIILNV